VGDSAGAGRVVVCGWTSELLLLAQLRRVQAEAELEPDEFFLDLVQTLVPDTLELAEAGFGFTHELVNDQDARVPEGVLSSNRDLEMLDGLEVVIVKRWREIADRFQAMSDQLSFELSGTVLRQCQLGEQLDGEQMRLGRAGGLQSLDQALHFQTKSGQEQGWG
jgi:hypothetical protein